MWPGIRPATGWIAYLTTVPFATNLSASCFTTCWAWARAIPYPGTIITSLALLRISTSLTSTVSSTTFSSLFSLTSSFLSSTTAWGLATEWDFGEIPNKILTSFLFIALHMIWVSNNPEAPTIPPIATSR